MQVLLRNLLALVGGAIVAGLVIAVIEAVGFQAYPPPAGFAWTDAAAVRAHLAALPAGAFLYVLAAYVAGTLAGVSLATRFSRRRPSRQGWLLGLVLLLAGLVNFLRYPHPAWFVGAALVGIAGAAWLGVLLGRPRRPD